MGRAIVQLAYLMRIGVRDGEFVEADVIKALANAVKVSGVDLAELVLAIDGISEPVSLYR